MFIYPNPYFPRSHNIIAPLLPFHLLPVCIADDPEVSKDEGRNGLAENIQPVLSDEQQVDPLHHHYHWDQKHHWQHKHLLSLIHSNEQAGPKKELKNAQDEQYNIKSKRVRNFRYFSEIYPDSILIPASQAKSCIQDTKEEEDNPNKDCSTFQGAAATELVKMYHHAFCLLLLYEFVCDIY